jgi:multiple antibiotic resistance protein
VFVLADAVGNIPIVLVLTKGMMLDQRNKVIDKAIIIAIAVLLLFTNVCQVILNYLKISIGSLGVKAEILLLLITLKILREELD